MSATLAEPLQEDHRQPLRGPRPAGDAGAARRRPRCRCRRAPRSTSSPAAGRGLKALASPALGSLARAYVRNEIDFTGSARRILGIVDAMVGAVAHGRDPARVRIRGLPAPAARQPPQHRAPLRRLQRVLQAVARRADGLFVRLFPRRRADARRRAGATSSTTSAASCGSPTGETLLDIGCGWGGLVFRAAEHYGVHGDRHHAVAATSSSTSGARSPRAASRAASTCELRDYLDLPEDVLYDKIASVGMFEHVGVRRYPEVFRQDLPRAEAGRLRAEPRHHAQHARRRQPGQRHRRFRRGLRVPGRRARARRRRSSRGWRAKGSS